MSEEDLRKFILKVESLRELVASLAEMPERRKQLSLCKTHNEVVNLAKLWGYEISRQWGQE